MMPEYSASQSQDWRATSQQRFQLDDYLEVADTLSDPGPGTGRYYVTAATYQGQTRYGRKTSNQVMSGRDPKTLAACNE